MHCPKCGEELSHLINYQPAEIASIFKLDREGRPTYYQKDTCLDDSTDGDYECPECNVVLARSEEDAIAFMKGEGISDEMAEHYMKLAMEGPDK